MWQTVESRCALHGVLTTTEGSLECLSSSSITLDRLRALLSNCKDNGDIQPLLGTVQRNALLAEVKLKGLQAEHGLNVANFLTDFLDWNKETPVQLKMALNMTYQFIYSVPSIYDEKWSATEIVCRKLIELLVRCTSEDQTMAATIIVILQLYVRRFKQNTCILQLWQKVVRAEDDDSIPTDMRSQIIMNFFDDFLYVNQNFYLNEELAKITQRLLGAENREERKAGYYILKKILEVCPNRSDDKTLQTSNYAKEHLSIYITIMENLEENQSHLILPSLQLLPVIEEFQQSEWTQWLDILYQRLLTHNNILVLRFTLEHFLQSHITTDLSLEMLTHLLNGFNNTLLYNYEGYFVPTSNISKFIYQNKFFITALGDIKWKSVPLHFWLTQLHKNSESTTNDINYTLIIKIASRVRMLQNSALRRRSIILFKELIKNNIDEMSVQQYVTFVTTLHNIKDYESAREILPTLVTKISHYKEDENCELKFSEQFYKIISNSMENDNEEDEVRITYFDTLVKFLENQPVEKHDWLRFFIIFDSPVEKSEKLKEFYKVNYNLDLDMLRKEKHCERVVNELKQKLLIGSLEKSVTIRCYDYFILQNINDLKEMTNWDLLDNLSYKAIHKLTKTNDKNRNIPIEKFLIAIARMINENFNCYDISFNVLQYCKQNLSLESYKEFVEKLLALDYDNKHLHFSVLNNDIPLSTETYIRGMLYGEVKSGEARVEQIYNITMGEMKFSEVRHQYVFSTPPHMIKDVLEKLKDESLRIARKKTRYFENSEEHRLQIRIAYAFSRLALDSKYVSVSTLLELLTMDNNHANVNIIYEFLIAKVSTCADILKLLTQICKYTPSHQISLIIVTHTFCIINEENLTDEEISSILKELLPLTMGANFQLRLYSQLSMYNIIKRHRVLLENTWNHTFNAIKNVLDDNVIEELMEDIRLKISTAGDVFNIFFLHSIVMYVTNAPIDEFLDIYNEHLYAKSKTLYTKRICNYAKGSDVKSDPDYNTPQSNVNYLQRKLNPTSDTLWKHDLSLAIKQDDEFYIVASLIDKLPNLGGIARSCEVLGVKNLVLDTKSCILKPDFKNLSMTAENSLNIIEAKANTLPQFLMQKQADGFKIIGAEQTANSVSFVGFQFPKKTVLILGHEKEGIPPNLLQFLDYAVEIPQNGLVRSLNVHVTAALFIWEYAKQHIINC